MHWWGLRAAFAVVLTAVIGGAGASSASATPNPFFGVDAVHYPTQAELNRLAQAGAGSVRIQIVWQFIEPSPGERVYTDLDRLVTMAASAGVTLVPTLYGTPPWLSRVPSSPPVYTAAERSAWRSLLSDYARRYGTNGSFWAMHPEIPKHPITTWEIWNEPNLGGFFGGRPSARAYARLLKISAKGLRAGDPAAQVLTGGLFPVHTIRNTVGMVSYLKALYRVHGVTNYFDAIGLHPYSPTPRGVVHWVRVARRIMDRHGDGAKPIWITEFGWVTGGKRFKLSPLKSTLSEQAQRLSATYGLLERNAKALGIASALWFSFTDHNTPGGPDFWTDRAGLFRLNGTPKPAWYAFARVAGGRP
jgi:polysaccharide biosynthesis protein PslG